jgi:Family of unknown function (DUF6252)
MSLARVLSIGCVAVMVSACGGGSSSTSSSTSSTVTGPSSATCPGGNRGSMSAVINGTGWTATCITTASYAGGIVSLGATDGTQSIGLGLTTGGLGTYTMTPFDPLNPSPNTLIANGLVDLLPASPASWSANSGTPGSSGTLTLTALSAIGVTGTFSFTAVATPGTGASGSKIVTNGVFNITF